MRERIYLWFKGWGSQFRVTWQQRFKKHGKRQSWRNAWMLGAMYRWVVYGQHYRHPGKTPVVGKFYRGQA